MPWHVIQGRYFMVYDKEMEPYNIYKKKDTLTEHSMVIVFRIDRGLVGTGLGCDGTNASPSNPEAHFEVDGATIALAAQWPANTAVFDGQGTGRLYFGAGLSKEKVDLLEPIFMGQAQNHNLDAFQSITFKRNPVGKPPTTAPAFTIREIPDPASDRLSLVEIDVPLTTIPNTSFQGGGQLRLETLPSESAPTENKRLVYADPTFRLGGQNPDLQGVILASAAPSGGSDSWWDDREIGTFAVAGRGEIRDFQWWGGDHLPLLFKTLNVAFLQAQFARFVMPVPIVGWDRD